jgi:uncharacterized protein (AIM24 family)
VDQFVAGSREKADTGDRFDKESERVLRIELDGSVWLKPGAAIAYRGDMRFERRHTMDARSVADAALREMAPLVRATGRGRLYCGHHGWHVHIVRLAGEELFVRWEELLAFEESLSFDTVLLAKGASVAAGGMVMVKLSGHGSMAVALHGRPLTLPVTPDNPVTTDPHATLAWSGGLMPRLRTDVSWRSLLHHGGQEPIQLRFAGHGFVVVQPSEDPARLKFDARKLVTALAG